MEKARKLAYLSGITRYQSAVPCKRDHLGERYTVNGICVRCDKEFIKPKMRQKKREMRVKKVPHGICMHCGVHFSKTNNANVYCSTECRFWSKVDRREDGQCWPWIGGFHPSGYGSFNLGGSRALAATVNAHRASYEIATGVPISQIHRKRWGDLYVCHTCDNRACVNPRHLYLGSHDTNMKDMDDRGRRVPRADRRYTQEQERAVLVLRALGWSQDKIAKEVKIPQTIVSMMVRGVYFVKETK